MVIEGSAQQLSLLVDLTYAADANASPGMGGCKADGGAGQDICGSFPLVVPYVGEGVPTFERYLIAHAASGTAVEPNANAAVNLGTDPCLRTRNPYGHVPKRGRRCDGMELSGLQAVAGPRIDQKVCRGTHPCEHHRP